MTTLQQKLKFGLCVTHINVYCLTWFCGVWNYKLKGISDIFTLVYRKEDFFLKHSLVSRNKNSSTFNALNFLKKHNYVRCLLDLCFCCTFVIVMVLTSNFNYLYINFIHVVSARVIYTSAAKIEQSHWHRPKP